MKFKLILGLVLFSFTVISFAQTKGTSEVTIEDKGTNLEYERDHANWVRLKGELSKLSTEYFLWHKNNLLKPSRKLDENYHYSEELLEKYIVDAQNYLNSIKNSPELLNKCREANNLEKKINYNKQDHCQGFITRFEDLINDNISTTRRLLNDINK